MSYLALASHYPSSHPTHDFVSCYTVGDHSLDPLMNTSTHEPIKPQLLPITHSIPKTHFILHITGEKWEKKNRENMTWLQWQVSVVLFKYTHARTPVISHYYPVSYTFSFCFGGRVKPQEPVEA